MDVELIEYKPNPDKLSALAGWACHRKDIPSMDEMKDDYLFRLGTTEAYGQCLEEGTIDPKLRDAFEFKGETSEKDYSLPDDAVLKKENDKWYVFVDDDREYRIEITGTSVKVCEPIVETILDKALSSGHVGVTEHTSFTFAVEGVSRSLTHQLVRHRIATYDQQSQREVDMDDVDFIIPESVKNRVYVERFEEILDEISMLYKDMQQGGIPNEDARFILPNATPSNIVITMNARVLNHFFKLRCCRRAQWEIREMAWRMLWKCKDIAPKIFEEGGPSCLNCECPEGEFSCGEPYSEEEAEEIFEKIENGFEGDYLFGNE